jgi:hypothetical protein
MYQELNGSNKWNGSALGVILLLGAAGAMAPVWLGVGQTDIEESNDLNNLQTHPRGQLNSHDFIHTVGSSDTDRNSERDEEEDSVGLRTENSSSSSPEIKAFKDKNISLLLLLIFLGLISNLTLLLSLVFWKLIPSMAMLGLYFAAWQCISAIFFTQLALSLKRVAVAVVKQELTIASLNEFNICTDCQKKRRVSASYVNRKVGDEDKDISFNMMNPMPNSTTRHPKYIGLSQALPSSVQSKQTDPLEESKGCPTSDRSINFSEKYKHHYIDVSIDGISETHSYISNSTTPVSMKDLECQCLGPIVTSRQEGREGDTKEAAPSYSMAIVAVVAASGLLQIIFLAVFFSSYAFPLRTAFFLLFLVYACSTCLYAFSALWRNGIAVLGKETCKLVMSCHKKWTYF